MVGEKLGSYRIEGTLGVGAMGVVYKATHEPSGRAAAVKVISKEIAQRGNSYDRFEREANILQQFKHPNIVKFLALGRSKGTSYIAMEFISGKTLEQILQEHEALPWKDVVSLGTQICEALHYAHERGVVHRDLKPSNLMVNDQGVVKLTDFGIAKDLDKTALTGTGRTLGTAAYMAPEQIRGTPEVSHKTDLYALGIVLYQLLVGRPPFQGASAVVLMHCHMNEPIPRPSARVAEIPRALDDLVVKLLAKSPSDRPWDASVVGHELQTILDRADKGEAVPMVWPTEGMDATSATQGSPTVVRKTKKKVRTAPTVEGSKSRKVLLLETAGLVLALAVVSGFIGYMLWPPSAPYLYRQAERLMASPSRSDWSEAIKEYIDPLDRRFPSNPYRAATRAWRDKIALDRAEGRTRVLQSPVNTKLNQPNDRIEEQWVEYFALVSAAEKRSDDLAEETAWRELAKQYRPDESTERPYHLLALKRAEEQHKLIEQRRSRVGRLLTQANASEADGRVDEAQSIRKQVADKDGKFSSVADLLTLPARPASTSKPDASAPSESIASPPGI